MLGMPQECLELPFLGALASGFALLTAAAPSILLLLPPLLLLLLLLLRRRRLLLTTTTTTYYYSNYTTIDAIRCPNSRLSSIP